MDWAKSHLTVFDLLDRLCTHHHDRKRLDGWGLVAGSGKRAFVPPDDPRHPPWPGAGECGVKTHAPFAAPDTRGTAQPCGPV